MLIYDRIKITAELCHVSLNDISNATGISINTMRNWNKTDASVSNLLPIARFLGVSLDCLVDYEDSTNALNDPVSSILSLERVKSTISQIIDEKIEEVRKTVYDTNKSNNSSTKGS